MNLSSMAYYKLRLRCINAYTAIKLKSDRKLTCTVCGEKHACHPYLTGDTCRRCIIKDVEAIPVEMW